MRLEKENDAQKLSSLSDEELIELYHNGNINAQDVIMTRYKNFVRSHARAYFLVGGDYEDIVQEGMIGLYKAIRDYTPERQSSFITFADICIKRQIISAIKTATRQKHSPLNYYVSLNKNINSDEDDRTFADLINTEFIYDPEEIVLSHEKNETMLKHIDENLSDFEKRVLFLYLDGLSYIQIGEKVGKEVKSIDNALQRIKKKLSTFKPDI